MSSQIIHRRAKFFNYLIIKTIHLNYLREFENHPRLSVFYHKGTNCVCCGLQGTILAEGLDRKNNIHIDLYAKDFNPLTVDHIIPRSKGGTDDLDNLQPMCYLCNTKKGDGDKPAYHYSLIHLAHMTRANHCDNLIGKVVYNSKKCVGKVESIGVHPLAKKQAVKVIGSNAYYLIDKLYVL